MIIHEKDRFDRVILEIIFKHSGSIFTKEGVSYFLASLLNNRGTLKHKETAFLSKFDSNAIHFSVETKYEFTTIHLTALSEKIDTAIKLVSELLKNPNFTEEAFKKTKKEIIAKKKNRANDNDYLADINLYKSIYTGTPLEYPIIGESIDSITLDDLKKHYEKTFTQANVFFLSGGNVEGVDIEKILAVLPKGKRGKVPFYTPIQSLCTLKKEVEQSYIHFASPFSVTYTDPNRYLMKVGTFILGSGGFGSRIMEEIRVKRGLAYSAYAHNSVMKCNTLLKGHLQTKIENQNEAISVLKELIADYTQKGVTADELDQSKKFLLGSEPLRNETLSQRLLKKYNAVYFNLEEDYFAKELELIRTLELDELNAFIKEHSEINELSFSIVTND